MPKQSRRKPAEASRSGGSSRKSATSSTAPKPAAALVEARNSPIHGQGVYALAPIRKGTRIIEYLGDRISHAEADRRYEQKDDDDGHTFLFIASNRTVIDAGVGGNDARFINHHCKPNCETVIENSRVFIDAIRDIEAGEELGYDYQLTWESTDDPAELALYQCRCGAKQCRGTMLDREPLDKKKPEKKTPRKPARNKSRDAGPAGKASRKTGKSSGKAGGKASKPSRKAGANTGKPSGKAGKASRGTGKTGRAGGKTGKTPRKNSRNAARGPAKRPAGKSAKRSRR